MSKKPTPTSRGQREDSDSKLPIFAIVIGLIVIAAVAGLTYLVIEATKPPEAIEGLIRVPFAPGAQHLEGQIYEFEARPPTGGPHNSVWQNCGIYDTVVEPEHAVHSLEHGAIWITYREDLSASELEDLYDHARGENHVLLSPYPNQESPIVLTSWSYQLEVDSANDDRIDLFKQRYIDDSATAPETPAGCSGGQGAPVQR